MIRPAYATIVLTLHREITLEIDDAADESEEALTDRVTQLAQQQFGMFDVVDVIDGRTDNDEIDILAVDYLDNRDD